MYGILTSMVSTLQGVPAAHLKTVYLEELEDDAISDGDYEDLSPHDYRASLSDV